MARFAFAPVLHVQFTPHSVTGFAPYTLLFGREPTIPLDHLINNAQQECSEEYAQEQARLVKKAYNLAKDRMIKAADANKRRYDLRREPEPLEVGSKVLVKKCAFTGRHKLSDAFHEEQHVVVDCNPEGDLFGIRPVLGGPKKWLNRKLLLLDPREEFTEDQHGLDQVLPEVDSSSADESTSNHDLGSSESENETSSDEELLFIPSDLFAPPPQDGSDTQPIGGESPHPQCKRSPKTPAHEPTGALRRSKRIAQRKDHCHGPDAIT